MIDLGSKREDPAVSVSAETSFGDAVGAAANAVAGGRADDDGTMGRLRDCGFVAELDSSPRSIQSLYGWYADKKLWVNRRYQRKLVWTLEEKQKLVASVLSGYPIPAILLAEREDGYEVIDGVQRLHTFMSFIETAFATDDGQAFDVEQFPTAHTRSQEGAFVISDEQEARLSAREVGTYLDYSVAISIMRGATDEDVDEVFSRINTYGHRLSDQERRQAGVQNNFSELVRSLSSAIRGDVSQDVLTLGDMPEISIDLPMAKHGYRVSASDVFWVRQGILRSTDLRDAMDEQCVADIAASVVAGQIIARSKDALDAIYTKGSDESERIDVALTSYGADKFAAELKYLIDQVAAICEVTAPPTKLRALLFSRQTTNPFPAVFTVLMIALHELLIVDDQKIADHTATQGALSNLDRRVDTSRGSTSPQERRQNVNTVKGLISSHLVPAEGRALYDDQSATDIDGAIRRSDIEAPHYELKQGLLRLDSSKQIDPGMLEKIIYTVCAIANNGPDRSGVLLLGVADTEADKNRVEQLYGVTARSVGRKFVVGVRREANALGESMEAYFGRLKTAVQNSDLSEPLKSAVLASIGFNDYFGLGIVIVNVPAQTVVSTVGERVFARSGDSTIEVTGRALVDVASRF
jgi:hypothetical protein